MSPRRSAYALADAGFTPIFGSISSSEKSRSRRGPGRQPTPHPTDSSSPTRSGWRKKPKAKEPQDTQLVPDALRVTWRTLVSELVDGYMYELHRTSRYGSVSAPVKVGRLSLAYT